MNDPLKNNSKALGFHSFQVSLFIYQQLKGASLHITLIRFLHVAIEMEIVHNSYFYNWIQYYGSLDGVLYRNLLGLCFLISKWE